MLSICTPSIHQIVGYERSVNNGSNNVDIYEGCYLACTHTTDPYDIMLIDAKLTKFIVINVNYLDSLIIFSNRNIMVYVC